MMLTERELCLSHQQYAALLNLYAQLAEFGSDSRFVAEVAAQFGLEPFRAYRIVVE